ncbi:hypothetical protein D9M69_699070 [compost metagenome]
MCSPLNSGNHLLNFLSRLLGPVSQSTNLVGYNSESSPLLPCSGRFDCGIECQKVGLISDGANDIEHLANISYVASQALHFARS